MSSLLTGVSGMRAHQELLDVVGNNLANINTPGYKAARATFADMISQTIRAGSGPTENAGGVNPSQVGLGVQVASIDRDLSQGSLQSTGRTLDLAIEGQGYFMLNDGNQDLYTRVGTLTLDSDNRLVSSANGFRVQGLDGDDIAIDVDASLPAEPTASVNLVGNLDATAEAPSPTMLASSQPFMQGTRATLGSGAGPFTLADGMQLSVRADGGATQTVTFNAADFADITNATAAEVAAAINGQLTGLTAADVGGAVQLQSDSSGASSSLDVDDGAGGPAAVLGLSTTITLGSETAANAATPLNDLPQNMGAYTAGDQIHLTGTDADGTPVSATFVYGTDGTTVGELVSFVQSQMPNATVALQADGTLEATANQDGVSPLQVTLNDDGANVGSTSFSNLPLVSTQPGHDGATVQTSIDVYDAQGGAHSLNLTMHKTDTNEWEITASLPDGGGTILDGSVQQIRFNDDGSFSFVGGSGLGDGNLEIAFNGLGATQTIDLNLGTANGFDGLTQFGGDSTASAADQDGFASGSLSSMTIDASGQVLGVYTNGQVQELATLGIATFRNPEGLMHVGENLFAVSSNSGVPVVGAGRAGRAGEVISGVLETSNVDIALEFTRLITAQRGFQVNSRTITTTDQMLQELANLVR